jgi:non-ribosomal peptide synthetase component E (peptide arylation enzyme)
LLLDPRKPRKKTCVEEAQISSPASRFQTPSTFGVTAVKTSGNITFLSILIFALLRQQIDPVVAVFA